MVRIVSDRLSTLIVILTLAFALVGQAFAPAAMAMQPDRAAMAGMSASDVCAGCADIDHSKAVPADCAGAVCAGLVAVLPATFGVQATFLPVFPRVAESEGRGITIPPPLGPPRPLHLA
jgi:hypothetical protein